LLTSFFFYHLLFSRAVPTLTQHLKHYLTPQDPGEHNDLALSMPQKAQQILARMDTAEKAWYNPNRGELDHRACSVAAETGYWGPFAN
jgi:hypothetical protein